MLRHRRDFKPMYHEHLLRDRLNNVCSHDIVEDTAEEDIILGCEVMAAVVERLEARLT